MDELLACWPQLAGQQLAAVVTPTHVQRDGTVTLFAHTPAWAAELQMLATELLRAFPPLVDGIAVTGLEVLALGGREPWR